MDNEFREIQLGVDKILNTNTIVRRKRKSSVDKKREQFVQLVNNIEELTIRQHIIYADLKLDFSNYDEKFYSVIDSLLHMNFGKQCTDVITFYLYERINSDGTQNALIVNDKEELFLQDAYDLWNLLCQINPKLNE